MSSSEWFGAGGPPPEGEGSSSSAGRPGGGRFGGPRPPVGLRRRRGPLGPTIAILVGLAFALSWAAGVWTEILWFDSVRFRSVFVTELSAKAVLFVVGFALTGGLVASSLIIGYRTRPVYAPVTPQQQNLDQYREAIEPLRRLATWGIPAVLGLLAGTGAAGQWKTYLLWRNRVEFGRKDPHFGLDLSFFVFDLPWVRFLLGFLTMALVMALIAAAFTHYVYGGIQLQGRAERTTHAARVHLSVLLAALVLVRAGSYWMDRYSLATKDGSLLTGIAYTDATATIPSKAILAVAALMTAGLFIASIWTRSWRLPVIGVASLVALSVLVGGLLPWAFQSLVVRPSEKSKEALYLDRHIKATRAAYGLEGVESQPYEAVTTASRDQLRNDSDTVPGIRLVDPIVVSPTFRQLQSVKSYYGFPDALDVDRYRVNGKVRDTVVAVRELDLDGVPANQRNWLNDHTVYTHGFGVVAAYGNLRGEDGQPVFYQQNIPPTGPLPEFEPRIYFGEQSPDYSIVGAPEGSRPREFDYPDSSAAGQQNNTYEGIGGVGIGSLPRRLAYAIQYRELKFLLSDAVNADSRLMYHRKPLERVQKIAPWLTLDGNPYPAVVEGRVKWIVDGYTTSADYPYSKLQEIDNATSDSVTETSTAVTAIRSGQVNYIRNSVKATVDAFDGTVQLYAWDEQDPLLKAWSKAFEGSVKPMKEISGELMSHLRYPEDLFKVQRMMLSSYHVTDADSFYGGQDFWRVPNDPAQEGEVYQPPYYLTLAMPGQPEPTFSLTTTFQPTGTREVLSGFLAVDADAGSEDGTRKEGYGKLRLLELPRNSTVRGPGQVANDINSSNATSDAFTLTLNQFLNQSRSQGSRVTMGNLLTLPVGGGLLYVQPIYVSAQGSSGYPLSRATVVAFGDRLAWSDTLDGALDGLFGGSSGATAGDSGSSGSPTTPGPTPSPTTPSPSDSAALAQALRDIQAAYDEGRAALAKGDFAAYGEAQKKLDDAIQRAVAASPKGGSVTVTPKPGSTATASPTGTATPAPTSTP
ncbi:MAG TPA: UPF0182 family protein [Pedococcus sp.]